MGSSQSPRPARGRELISRGARTVTPALLALALALAAAGCGASHPKRIALGSLAEAQTFPYYPLYWVGPSFEGHVLVAADGQNGYISSFGDSVYYGDCVHGKGIFGGGSCLLPLQVTTVIYQLHSNATLGPQRNILVRGVPAVVYDEGRSIELYSGRVAIDIFSDNFARTYAAAQRLLPVNAPGVATGSLPAPIYCPGLSGAIGSEIQQTLDRLPHNVCQRAHAEQGFLASIS